MPSEIERTREALERICDIHKRNFGRQDEKLADIYPIARAALASLPDRTGEPVAAIPTQKQMNEAFYVDVCRAEDRLKEFIAASRALIEALPPHWHGEAETSLRDLCDETSAVLNPHMHTPYEVEQASKRYGGSALAPPDAEQARLRERVVDERARAAKIARDFWIDGGEGTFDEGVDLAAHVIANRIEGKPDHPDEEAPAEARLAQQAERATAVTWRPISEADSGIAYIHDFPGVRIGNSYPVWVRDEDGRVYEALWADNGKNAYWWDIEGESPVDPVEFAPHPLSLAEPQQAVTEAAEELSEADYALLAMADREGGLYPLLPRSDPSFCRDEDLSRLARMGLIEATAEPGLRTAPGRPAIVPGPSEGPRGSKHILTDAGRAALRTSSTGGKG